VLRRVRDTVTEHPITGTRRQPEFLATSEGADPLVMEMTLTGASAADRSRARRLDTIYDQINSWEIPNFLLHIVVASEGSGNPSLRRLRRELLDWIGALDVDKIAAMRAASPNYLTDQSVPRHIWSEAGWSIEFRVIPRKPERRAATKDAIGLYGPHGAWVGNPEPIRRRLAEKASAYGDFAGPFVVAVLLDRMVSDDTSVTEVLYGDQALIISTDDFDAGEFVRRPNGSWFKPDGWHHTNVSAVLAVSGLVPWTVNTAVPTLWHHPAARFPVDEIAPVFRQATPNLNTGRVEFSAPAIDPAAFFDLSSDWPGPEAAFGSE
jgi:hypothetical protein